MKINVILRATIDEKDTFYSLFVAKNDTEINFTPDSSYAPKDLEKALHLAGIVLGGKEPSPADVHMTAPKNSAIDESLTLKKDISLIDELINKIGSRNAVVKVLNDLLTSDTAIIENLTKIISVNKHLR